MKQRSNIGPVIPGGKGPRRLWGLGVLVLGSGLTPLVLDAMIQYVPGADPEVEEFHAGLVSAGVTPLISGMVTLLGICLMLASHLWQGTKAPKIVRPANREQPVSGARPLDPDDEEVVEAVRQAFAKKPGRTKKGLSHTLALLGISLLLFVVALKSDVDMSPAWIAPIVLVLAVHELGHFLAMWAFGYSDLRAFFIPFFGAAVTGTKRNASPTQRALVSLAGPLPGLLFALGVALSGPQESQFLQLVALIALSLNAFNLLPIMHLDGGQFLDVTLFSRWPKSRQIMGHLSGLALIGIGWGLESKVLLALGFVIFLTAGVGAIYFAGSRRIREEIAHLPEIPAEMPDCLIPVGIRIANELVYNRAPIKPTALSYANLISVYWARVGWTPPTRGKAVGLLGVYVLGLVLIASTLLLHFNNVATLGVYSWHENGSIRSFGKRTDGGKQGIWETWYPNGDAKSEALYVDGMVVGAWRKWDEQGECTTGEPLAPLETLVGDHYQVHGYFQGTPSIRLALQTAESVWETIERWLPNSDEPIAKLDIHLFRDREQYESVVAWLSDGHNLDQRSWFAHKTATSYHFASASCSDTALNAVLLPGAARAHIAKHATQAALHELLPAFRALPYWLKDAFQREATSQALAKANPESAASGDEPFTSSMVWEAQRLANSGTLPKLASIVNGEIDSYSYDERGAARWLLFKFMARDNRTAILEGLLGELAAVEDDFKEQTQAIIHRWLPDTQLREWDSAFASFAHSLNTGWTDPHKSLCLTVEGMSQVGRSSGGYYAWRGPALTQSSYAIQGSANIVQGRAHLTLGYEGDTFLMISFTPGKAVRLYGGGYEGWEELAKGEFKHACGQPFTFQIRVAGDTLTLFMDDVEVLTAALGSWSTRGRWGLAVDGESAALWSDIESP